MTSGRPSYVRHLVLWMTVLVYLITYLDRQVISIALPFMKKEYHFSSVEQGWIIAAFQLSYALFQIPGGWLGDKIGPRKALSAVVIWWSGFTALTAFTWSTSSLVVCRFLFGMGEAGAFPIATRSLSRWMLPAERGWAQGITHAGSRFGAVITPPLALFAIQQWGWRSPFLILTAIGLVWAVGWFLYYRDTPAEHKDVNAEERALIEGAVGREKVRPAIPWKALLSKPQLWILSLMYFCYGYGIVFFLQWFPTYLVDARGVNLKNMGLVVASLPLAFAFLGDVCGGLVSDALLKHSNNLTTARRLVGVVGFLIAAATIPVAALAPDPKVSIALFCLALFALELTVGVSWAVALDIGGPFAGTVSSVMNMFGNGAGFMIAWITGYMTTGGQWEPTFFVISGLLVVAGLLFLLIDASTPLVAAAPTPDSQ